MPVSKRDVISVQRCYPQIYLACHTRHERRRANAAALTAQESSLLAHLSAATPMRCATLARHLGVGPSTLSAAVKRLTSLGYIARERDDADGRAVSLRLSTQGAKAMQAGSVLDTSEAPPQTDESFAGALVVVLAPLRGPRRADFARWGGLRGAGQLLRPGLENLIQPVRLWPSELSRRVAAMLSHLNPTARARAVEGLALLAGAALRVPKRGGR